MPRDADSQDKEEDNSGRKNIKAVIYFKESKSIPGDRNLISSFAAGEMYFPLLRSNPYLEMPAFSSISDKSLKYSRFLSLG